MSAVSFILSFAVAETTSFVAMMSYKFRQSSPLDIVVHLRLRLGPMLCPSPVHEGILPLRGTLGLPCLLYCPATEGNWDFAFVPMEF